MDLCLPLVNVEPLAIRAYERYGSRQGMAVAVAGQRNQSGIELKVKEIVPRLGHFGNEARAHALYVRDTLPPPTLKPLFVPLSRGKLPANYLGAAVGGFTAVFAVSSLKEGEWSEAIAALLAVESIRESTKREHARLLMFEYLRPRNRYASIVAAPLDAPL